MDLVTWAAAGLVLAYAIECVVWPYKRWGRLVFEGIRRAFR